jgi:hypothetical protein
VIADAQKQHFLQCSIRAYIRVIETRATRNELRQPDLTE